jgi:hypothetical protein
MLSRSIVRRVRASATPVFTFVPVIATAFVA